MMRHSETDHSVGADEHADCLEIAKELLEEVESKNYPEHVVDLIKGIIGELEEYEEDGEEMEEEDENIYEATDEDGEEDGKNPDEEMNDGEDELTNYVKKEIDRKSKR
jgi:hypothetical protein